MGTQIDPSSPPLKPTRELVVVGSGVLERELAPVADGFTLVSQDGPRKVLNPELVARAGHYVEATSLDATHLEELVRRTPADQAVVGVGGGVAMDTAKWIGWSHHAPLYLVPSSISVDASVTNMIAVREDGGVRYQGFAVPRRVIVDVNVVRTAPVNVNRAGIGDLLSIHTGLFDWHLGAKNNVIAFDEDVAEDAQAILRNTIRDAEEISRVSEDGVTTLMAGYCDINDMTIAMGHAQMEEGSEHYFAYFAEQVTGTSFVHGELVTLGVVLMSRWQENNVDLAHATADRAQVRWRPEELGISAGVLTSILEGLSEFVASTELPYSVINERPLNASEIGTLVKGLV
jgi:glycerol-1-phosphate dehydrogenase [NAD(P)+]